MAALENKSGNYVVPRPRMHALPCEEAKFNEVLGATVPDPKGANAYPIVSFTWVVCRKSYQDKQAWRPG